MLILKIFVGIVPTLVGTKKWKPEKEELEKELRRLGLAKEDVKMSKLEDEIVLDPADPIENVEYIKSTFNFLIENLIVLVQIKCRYLPTGHYLRPHDMEFCIRSTDFNEDEIYDWFKRFRKDCPNGKLGRAQLRSTHTVVLSFNYLHTFEFSTSYILQILFNIIS